MNLHTSRVYNHTGYDVTMYFRSGVIDVRKRAENDNSDGYNLESPKSTSLFTTPVTSLTTSDWQLSKFKKQSKMPPQTASGRISRERFKRESPNFRRLSGTNGPTNLWDMTSLVASGRLQNAIKYWTNVMRKTGLRGQRVK